MDNFLVYWPEEITPALADERVSHMIATVMPNLDASRSSTATTQTGDQQVNGCPPATASYSPYEYGETLENVHHMRPTTTTELAPGTSRNYTESTLMEPGEAPLAPIADGAINLEFPFQMQTGHGEASEPVAYPVLQPLIPHVESFLSAQEACRLLELYFSSNFESRVYPGSPYIHTFVFRKASILRRENPRPCSNALLASMLWVSAHGQPPRLGSWLENRQQKVCLSLFRLTVQLLRPLLHEDFGCTRCDAKSRPCLRGTREDSNPWPLIGPGEIRSASLDDVVTYIHIATVVSGSEYRAASMKWWQAAFSVARELKLNVEPPCPPASESSDVFTNLGIDAWFLHDSSPNPAYLVNDEMAGLDNGFNNSHEHEEERAEERRRVWWLLYIHDRHLALCYNLRPTLLDAECVGLPLPIDESIWQSEEYFSMCSRSSKLHFPSFGCTGYDIFGFFLPLMTIQGEVLEYNKLKSDTLLGTHLQALPNSNSVEDAILRHIETYQGSLGEFAAQNREDASPEESLHTKTVVAYAKYVSNVMFVLLSGKLDPATFMESRKDSHTLLTTMNHSIAAANSIDEVLKVNFNLGFMSFFLSIYLLQGSLALLAAVEVYQSDTSQAVMVALESNIRAIEGNVSTIDTSYMVCSAGACSHLISADEFPAASVSTSLDFSATSSTRTYPACAGSTGTS